MSVKTSVKRAHITIHGKVQEVFFRAYMEDKAQSHNLTGWIKNCFDGTVEVVLEGNEDDVKQVVEWAHTGPSNAEVKKVDVSWEKPTNEFSEFSIQYA